MFNDDEEPIVPAPNAGKRQGRGRFSEVGKASVKPYCPKEAPLSATTVRVLLDVSSSSSTAGRAALDLVVVLDVSGSMRDFGRLDKLKSAMQFIIRKLSPMDRLSIVTFNNRANYLSPLRAMTSEDAAPALTGIVERLIAKGGTNIEVGLRMGLEVLDGRRHAPPDRTAAVILMSDGKENAGSDATRVLNPRRYPVYTLSFGAEADMNLLQQLASGNGTYNPVLDEGGMSMLDVFSQLMAGLLTVVVRDLCLILSKPQDQDLDLQEIAKVAAGDFRQETDPQSGTVTVKFGDLFSGEVRKVVVELLLKDTSGSSGYNAQILDMSVSYVDVQQGERENLPAQTLTVKRTRTATGKETTPELEAELRRREHADHIRGARILADQKQLEAAKQRLRMAQSELAGVLGTSNNPMVAAFSTELQQLLDRMETQELYEKEGRPYALAAELSHARQRFAARGVSGVRLFATPRMDEYLLQANKFAEDPSAPVPGADADEKVDAVKEKEEEEKKEKEEEEKEKEKEKEEKEKADADRRKKEEEELKEEIRRVDDEPSTIVYYMQVAMSLLQGIGGLISSLWRRLGYGGVGA